MPLAVSNIGLPAYEHSHMFTELVRLGFDGIEVAPSRIWRDTWQGLQASDVSKYRREIEKAGLKVVGLHSLFFDQPELSLFGDEESRVQLIDFMVHLSSVCRDLGGKTLVFGSPSARRRDVIPLKEAHEKAAYIFTEILQKTQGHGTVLCMEPLGPTETDFCNTIAEIKDLYDVIDHPGMGIQLDMRALSANQESALEMFESVKDKLVHVHVNAKDLGILNFDDGVQHEIFGQNLKEIGYGGYLSLEQRSVCEDDYLKPLTQSLQIIEKCYL